MLQRLDASGERSAEASQFNPLSLSPLSRNPPPPAVFDVDHDAERAAAAGMEVNGFNFEGMDAPGMDYALNRLVSIGYPLCVQSGAVIPSLQGPQ